MDHLAGALKKGGIKDRTDSVLDAHFRSQVVDWWTRKQNAVIKEDIAKAIKESLEHEHEHERRNGEYRRLPQWAAGPAKLNYDPATLAQVPKASKRSSPLRNWRDGLWSSEGDGGGEGMEHRSITSGLQTMT
ncbi:hypothetical protein EDB85DRAFT_2155980 [Lactarius pseudohatsudake]|nr:hypothetical protein EDB85DRAFT_2155980 [Lactarius pseudohatsudake]